MGVKEEILYYCSSLGIDSIGFIKCRKFNELKKFYEDRKKLNLENEFEENDIKKRINPLGYLENGKTIISIGFPYFSLEKININNKEKSKITIEDKHKVGFSVYTRGTDYHYVLNKYLNEIINIIEKHKGVAKSFVDSNSLPERYIAYLAGVGFIGKNNLIINEKYGSYMFLGEIITDLEIYDEDKGSFKKINKYEKCKECTLCYEKCPTKAINSNIKNCNICVSYLTQKKQLEDWEMKKLEGKIFGCDSCQKKCPYNEKIEFSKIPEFAAFDFMDTPNDDYVINMTNSQFKETLKKTSCGWRGKNILKRNAIIRKALYEKVDISNIENDSQYVQEYINRLKIFKK